MRKTAIWGATAGGGLGLYDKLQDDRYLFKGGDLTTFAIEEIVITAVMVCILFCALDLLWLEPAPYFAGVAYH